MFCLFVFLGGDGGRGAFWIIKQYACRKEHCSHGGTHFKCLWVPFDYILCALNNNLIGNNIKFTGKISVLLQSSSLSTLSSPPLQTLCPHPPPPCRKRACLKAGKLAFAENAILELHQVNESESGQCVHFVVICRLLGAVQTWLIYLCLCCRSLLEFLCKIMTHFMVLK